MTPRPEKKLFQSRPGDHQFGSFRDYSVRSIAFSADSRRIAVGSIVDIRDGNLTVRDLPSYRVAAEIQFRAKDDLEGQVWAVALSPDGKRVANTVRGYFCESSYVVMHQLENASIAA